MNYVHFFFTFKFFINPWSDNDVSREKFKKLINFYFFISFTFYISLNIFSSLYFLTKISPNFFDTFTYIIYLKIESIKL